MSFELPIMMPGRPVPDNETQYVKDIEAKFHIQVFYNDKNYIRQILNQAMNLSYYTLTIRPYLLGYIFNKIKIALIAGLGERIGKGSGNGSRGYSTSNQLYV